MALKIWMPFVNDTENQGLCSTATLQKTVDAYTAQTDGKLGGAYSGYSLYHASEEFLGNQWSVAAWVNAISFGQYNNIIFCKNISSSTDCHIYWSVISNTTYNIGINGPSGTTTYTYTFTANTWYHLATTYDGSRIKMYINGNLVKDVAYTSTQATGCLNFGLGARSSNAAGTSATAAGNWKFNDFRLYDTAISAKEVEELARGLVLHYKLDGGIMRGENLIANSALGNTWTYPSSSYSDKYSPVTLSIPTGDVYTLSFDAKSTVAGDIIRTHYYSPNTTTTCISSQGTTRTAGDGYMTFRLSTAWERYWVTYYQSSTTAVKHIICPRLMSGEGSGSVSVRHVKFEEGTIATPWSPAPSDASYDTAYSRRVYDCSGYKHHGTINDTGIVVAADTARYTGSTKNNQAYNSGTYPLSGPLVLNNIDQITISLWARPTTMGHQDSGIFSTTAASLPTDYQTTVCNHYDGYLACCNTSGTVVRLSVGGQFTLNEWHLYTFTYDGANVRFYKDGLLKTSAAQSGKLKPITQIFPFYSKAGGANRTTSGCLSDVRVYVTALSDKQVLELYNENAAIDRSGTYYTRELIEQ